MANPQNATLRDTNKGVNKSYMNYFLCDGWVCPIRYNTQAVPIINEKAPAPLVYQFYAVLRSRILELSYSSVS